MFVGLFHQIARLVCCLALSIGVNLQAAELRFGEVEVLIGPTEPTPPGDAKSELNAPFAMEFNQQGEMIVVEYDGGRLLSWSPQQGLSLLAGDGKPGLVDGPAGRARFNKLHNLAIASDGRYLLSDHENHSIRIYDPATKLVSTLAGNGTAGPAVGKTTQSEARFRQPICISLSPTRDSLLIADIDNRVIRRLSVDDKTLTIVAGNGTRGKPIAGELAIQSPLSDPRGAIEDESGNLYLIERGGNSLWQIDLQGRLKPLAGGGAAGLTDGPLGKSKMNGPKHLCFGPSGIIFIADDNNHAVRYYDPKTEQLATVDFGSYRLNRPHGVCFHDNALYVADSYHHRILRVRLLNQ